MGSFIEGHWGEKYCLLFIDEMSRKAFIKPLNSRSEVSVTTLELIKIKKEQRRTQASLVYLRNDGAKDYGMKVLQDFLRQEGISHEVTEKILPSMTGLETQPHHHGQSSLHAYRCKLDPQAFAFCSILCSAHLQ
jgi:hypothetical protein